MNGRQVLSRKTVHIVNNSEKGGKESHHSRGVGLPTTHPRLTQTAFVPFFLICPPLAAYPLPVSLQDVTRAGVSSRPRATPGWRGKGEASKRHPSSQEAFQQQFNKPYSPPLPIDIQS